MPKYLVPIDMTKQEIQNVHAQVLSSDPTIAAGDKGQFWYNSTTNRFKGGDNTATPVNLTNIIESVSGTAPISVAAVTALGQVISIVPASASVPGSMTAAHYSLVQGAASINTASTLVLRDGSGNFAAGTITAALTGTASNATNLNNQADTYYLSRTNHTGTQLASTVSNFTTAVQAIGWSTMVVPAADVSINSHKLTGLLDPTGAQDAATKNYVDGVASGLDVKLSVRAASTANFSATYTAAGGASARGQLTAAPTPTIDGITLTAGQRVLLKNQTTAAQNGIWVVTTPGSGANGVWDRATDFDTDAEVTTGAFTFVEEGTTQGSSGWVLTTANPIIIGGASGTSLSFAQFSGSGTYIGGAGLTLTGTTFDVVGTANRITVAADSVDISTAYVGQATITTLGTITTGTWTGTTIAVANGGTGSTTAGAARTALNVVGKAVLTAGTGIVLDAATTPVANCAATLGNAALTSFVVTHDRNNKDVQVVLTEVSTDQEVFANVTHTSTSTVTIAFTVAPTSAQYRLVILG